MLPRILIRLFLCGCALHALSALATAPPALGTPLSEAKAALGTPEVEASLPGNRTLLWYPRGRLFFTDGKLSEINFLTAEQFSAQQETRRQAAEEIAREKARRESEGVLLWEHLRQSPEFTQLSGTAQFVKLVDLQARYPSLPLAAEMAAARQRAETEIAHQRVLRAQADEAEARAREAEATARLAEQRTHEPQGLQVYTYSPWSNYLAPRPVIAIGGFGTYVRPPHRPIVIIRNPKPEPPVTPPSNPPKPPKKPSPPVAPPKS